VELVKKEGRGGLNLEKKKKAFWKEETGQSSLF